MTEGVDTTAAFKSKCDFSFDAIVSGLWKWLYEIINQRKKENRREEGEEGKGGEGKETRRVRF